MRAESHHYTGSMWSGDGMSMHSKTPRISAGSFSLIQQYSPSVGQYLLELLKWIPEIFSNYKILLILKSRIDSHEFPMMNACVYD